MRENMGIYRGKRLDNGEWVEGYLYEHQPPLQGIVTKDYMPEKSKWYILKTAFADWNMPRQVEFIEIDPATVGEWTGPTDKNGKLIFEGDIIGSMDGHDGYLSCEGYIVGVVNWDDETLSWQVTNRIEAESCEILASDNETLKIIGNIHDNPELMEVDHD